MRTLILACAACGFAACSSTPPDTTINSATYPASFPMQVGQPTPGDDATWYKVTGLTTGGSYTAAISLSSASIALGDAAVFVERNPNDVGMNDLCTMNVPQNMTAASCTFTSAGAFAYIGVVGPKEYQITLSLGGS